MARVVEITPNEGPPVRRSRQQREAFEEWLFRELERAQTARQMMESAWVEALRLYEARPKLARRDVPIKNAPNVVVPLSGIATDSVYAQVLDLIFQIEPVVTVRGQGGDADEKTIGALQKWTNHRVKTTYGFRRAMETMLLDTCQLGSGFGIVHFEREFIRRKADVARREGPRIRAVAPDDLFVPGGTCDLEDAQWVGTRSYMNTDQLVDRERLLKWDLSKCEPCGTTNRVRLQRQRMARTREDTKAEAGGELYEIFELFVQYDINGDGAAEDMHVVYDMHGRHILRIRYNPYETKPVVGATYQRRSHQLYGIGVPEMLAHSQEAATEILCFWLVNMLLANSRVWLAPPGTIGDDEEIWPGRVLESGNPDAFKALEMADVYQSAPQAVGIVTGLAERRVGVNELSAPRQGASPGSRTPGITALTLQQQVLRRFVPAFDSMREMGAEAVRQCLYREHEQLMRGSISLVDEMERVLGQERARAVGRLMRRPDFNEQVAVELTASSASTNKSADRQEAILLLDRLFGYYERLMALAQVAYTPGAAAPQVQEIAKEIADRGNTLVLGVLRQFDSVSDPESLLVHLRQANEQIGAMVGGAGEDEGIAGQLLQLLGGAQGGAAGAAVGGYGGGGDQDFTG